jgi:hypothetical protein
MSWSKIVVNDVELRVEQTDDVITVTKVIGKDRRIQKDIVHAVKSTFASLAKVDLPPAVAVVALLKRVAQTPTKRCTCGYRYGYSDHAAFCQSLYVASDPFLAEDD